MTANINPAIAHLSDEDFKNIQAELDAVYKNTMDKVGQDDVNHIRKMIRIATGCEVSGRGLLAFGFDPISFVVGSGLLGVSKIMDNMEIGHNIMHGQYDWTGDPKLKSQTFEWDTACDGEAWRHSHNVMHHTHTNIVGRDRDVGYGILRLSDEQKWEPKYLFNPLWNAMLAAGFQWGVGLHDLEFDRVRSGDMSKEEFRKRAQVFGKKAWKVILKDYILFPLLAFWNWPRVLLGNLLANLIRNLWSYAVIFCGHFTEGVSMYTEEQVENEDKGRWYVRQITGSSNIEGGRVFHIMSGHLSHQIEHHLFPDMPAHRYAEVAPQVQAICEKYKLPYNTGTLAKQYFTVLKRVFKYSLPPKNTGAVAAAA